MRLAKQLKLNNISGLKPLSNKAREKEREIPDDKMPPSPIRVLVDEDLLYVSLKAH